MTPATIQQAVATAHGMTRAELMARTHRHAVAHVRQAAMYLVRELRPDLSLPQIARGFGFRDHTTVLHGIVETTKRLRNDPALVERMDVARLDLAREEA